MKVNEECFETSLQKSALPANITYPACAPILLSGFSQPQILRGGWGGGGGGLGIRQLFAILLTSRLDYQPFCEPAFLAPHHGWITGLPIVFLDQSQRSLLKSSRLPCDWSILSLVYPTWRISVRMIFLFLESVC